MDMGLMAVEKSWFAILNENDIVEDVMLMPSAVEGPDYIKIPAEDQSLVGMKYNRETGKFEEAVFYYAELNKKGIVIGITRWKTPQTADNLIRIETEDLSLVGKWYDRANNQFIDPPAFIIAAHSTDEICYKQEDKWLSQKLDEMTQYISNFFRAPNRSYRVGDVVRDISSPNWAYLECSTCGVSSELDLSQLQHNIGKVIVDGTAVWVVRKHDHPQVGTVLDWENAKEPEAGWLKCNGDICNSNDYPLLAAILDPTNTGTFTVPDRRGYVPRGLDEGAGVDSESKRVVGSKQEDAIKSHNHTYHKLQGPANADWGIHNSNGAWADGYRWMTVSTGYEGGSENRVKNVATKYYICYA